MRPATSPGGPFPLQRDEESRNLGAGSPNDGATSSPGLTSAAATRASDQARNRGSPLGRPAGAQGEHAAQGGFLRVGPGRARVPVAISSRSYGSDSPPSGSTCFPSRSTPVARTPSRQCVRVPAHRQPDGVRLLGAQAEMVDVGGRLLDGRTASSRRPVRVRTSTHQNEQPLCRGMRMARSTAGRHTGCCG